MPSIYYKNGFQGRKVLKAIWEDRELRTLQTDGYNVYLYFNDEMLDTEHGCCMSYVRAKFKYAAGTGMTFTNTDAPDTSESSMHWKRNTKTESPVRNIK